MSGFTIEIASCETCDGISFQDTTGFFSSSNTFGYNSPPLGLYPQLDINGVFTYDSYSLSIWDPTQDPTVDAALFTYDLLAGMHSVDATTGVVIWPITYAQLGVTMTVSGIWYMRVTAVFTDSNDVVQTYAQDGSFCFRQEVQLLIDKMMAKADPSCECDCNSQCDPWRIYAVWLSTSPMGCCGQSANFSKTITWVRNNAQLCC